MLSVAVLGPLGVWDAAGISLLPRVRKTRAVLAILALAAPEPVLRSRLIALLWSRRGLAQARGSLRQAIHELRRRSVRPRACSTLMMGPWPCKPRDCMST